MTTDREKITIVMQSFDQLFRTATHPLKESDEREPGRHFHTHTHTHEDTHANAKEQTVAKRADTFALPLKIREAFT